MLSRNPVVLAPAVPKDFITKSDGITIDDEVIVKNMTQFRGKSQKEGTIDVYWWVVKTEAKIEKEGKAENRQKYKSREKVKSQMKAYYDLEMH